MYELLKPLIVKDCPHLPITVTCPVRSDYLHIRVTNIPPRKHGADYQLSTDKLSKIVKLKTYFFDASDSKMCRNVLKEMGEEISMV